MTMSDASNPDRERPLKAGATLTGIGMPSVVIEEAGESDFTRTKSRGERGVIEMTRMQRQRSSPPAPSGTQRMKTNIPTEMTCDGIRSYLHPHAATQSRILPQHKRENQEQIRHARELFLDSQLDGTSPKVRERDSKRAQPAAHHLALGHNLRQPFTPLNSNRLSVGRD